MLQGTDDLSEKSIEKVMRIQKASKQLEDLTENYREYINKKSIAFKMSDLNTIIDDSIEITSERLRKYNINLAFQKSISL